MTVGTFHVGKTIEFPAIIKNFVAPEEFLTEEGYDEVMGVRPLRRVIEQQIRDNVTDFHLENLDAKHLVADLEDGILVIKEKSETDKKTEEKKVSKNKKSLKKDTE